MNKNKKTNIKDWLKKCEKYKSYLEIPKEWGEQKELVNPYVFLNMLSDELGLDDAIVVDGGGTVLYMAFQGIKLKEGQRMIVSSGVGAMGSGLPESIGACFASGGKRTICVVGDGSFQFNIQELQTIFHHKLPVKIMLLNNDGYRSIRMTQEGFLKSNYVGTDKTGGISFPDYQKVVEAYGIKFVRATNHENLRETIQWVLQDPGPVVCEVMLSRDQELIPRMGFKMNPDGTGQGMPLEDMWPFLDRKEFYENMVVEPLPESKY